MPNRPVSPARPTAAPLARWVGHTRYVVLLAVLAVLLVALALVLLAAMTVSLRRRG